MVTLAHLPVRIRLGVMIKLAAASLGMGATPVFTYLANTIRLGGHEIPYSLVAAMPGVTPGTRGIVLNDWAARDLGAKPGDSITLEYYVWKEEGRLATESATFPLASMRTVAASKAGMPATPRSR